MNVIDLKYGCNPHQRNASLLFSGEKSPLQILNSKPSYVNILDAFSAWQLVKELKDSLHAPAAASFKHLSPAGAAIAKPLSKDFLKSQFITTNDLSPIATAYIRARGGDRMCSFGDAVAVSDKMDASLANILKSEVSDLIIAPDYEPAALEVLKKKKNGGYLILQINPNYEPQEMESKEIFGFTIRQNRNTIRINENFFSHAVTENKSLPSDALQSLLIATIALKYTQSNSVSVAYDGQIIGVGAGQQSRVHCLRLACSKADKWFMQQHPKILEMEFRDKLVKPEKANVVDQLLLWDELSGNEKALMRSNLKHEPQPISVEEKMAFISLQQGVCLSSDAFFPFRDNIDRAARTNVRYIAHPGGSMRDSDCINAANEYGMVMFHTGTRLFTH